MLRVTRFVRYEREVPLKTIGGGKAIKLNSQNEGQSAAPTFFDGSYFSLSNDGTLLHSESETKPPLFDYSIPRWRYIYNATLVVLDLLMTLIATGIKIGRAHV